MREPSVRPTRPITLDRRPMAGAQGRDGGDRRPAYASPAIMNQAFGSGLAGAPRVMLHRPIEVMGLVVIAGMTGAILVNALSMQTGSHPAPLFARQAVLPSAIPLSRTAGETAPLDEQGVLVRDIQVGLAAHASYDGPTDGVLGPKTDAAIRGFQVGAGLPVDGRPTAALLARIQTSKSRPVPPQPVPAPTAAEMADPIGALIKASAPARASTQPDRRVLAAEQALALLGYGPLKVDGLLAPDTKASIERFQRDRSLPVDGEVSPRLMRELQAVSGQPISGPVSGLAAE